MGQLPLGGEVPCRVRASLYDFKFTQAGSEAWWDRRYIRRVLEASLEGGILVDEELADAMRARGEEPIARTRQSGATRLMRATQKTPIATQR